MKKISLLLVVSILVLNVVTISSLAAVQSDAEAGQWAKTYVFDDFNQRPTGKTVTYKPDGTPAWEGVDTTSPSNGNLYRSINAVNTISSDNSYNKNLVQHMYGWNTNTNGGKGMTGWFGSVAEGYYAFSDTSVTNGANGMEVLGSQSVTANMPYTPQSNLSVDWDKDTVEISCDYLWSGAQDGGNNTFMMRIYDTYYNKETKQYDSKGRTDRIISYMPQVRRLASGNLQIKVFDETTGVVATLDKDAALSLFNIDTSYAVANAQWVHMTAVITKSGTTYTSKFYVNGRPLSGTVGDRTLSGSYNVTLADVTDTNYEHKGISYYATAATPDTTTNGRIGRQLFNGIDNIRFVKYNSSTTMPSEMTIDSDTSNIVIPFINNYYNSSLPDGVKAAAVDLGSFTIQATKNGVDISSEITPDYAKATRTSDSTTNQLKDTYITQDGKSLKLKGITSNPGDTIVIKLNGIKDVTGKALTNDTITLTNPAKVSVSDFKIDENGKATATVKNNATSEQKCIFVIGDYKDAATLIAANISDVTLQAGASKNIEVSITKADGHSFYKAFIWDKTDLTPYADSIEK